MNNLSAPFLDAEIAYRREQIAHDYAVAQGWELSLRRAAAWARRVSPRHLHRPQPATSPRHRPTLNWH